MITNGWTEKVAEQHKIIEDYERVIKDICEIFECKREDLIITLIDCKQRLREYEFKF